MDAWQTGWCICKWKFHRLLISFQRRISESDVCFSVFRLPSPHLDHTNLGNAYHWFSFCETGWSMPWHTVKSFLFWCNDMSSLMAKSGQTRHILLVLWVCIKNYFWCVCWVGIVWYAMIIRCYHYYYLLHEFIIVFIFGVFAEWGIICYDYSFLSLLLFASWVFDVFPFLWWNATPG